MRRRGWTLPEVMIAGSLALILFGLVAAVFHYTVGASNQTYVHLDVQLSCQEWLTRMADDVAQGQDRRLFANRCEVDILSYSELVRFDSNDPEQVYDPSARTLGLQLKVPLGQPEPPWNTAPAAYNFDQGARLEVRSLDSARIELVFPGPPRQGDRLVLNYPVQNLVTYWLDESTGRLHREERDSQGRTTLEVLNPAGRSPDILCRGLRFTD
ncbi:MAG: hypothetical protein AB1758_12510, partial [Candidatus Eremiobacterota bacterium]